MMDIRQRVLTALALNRTPGFHFSGNFLGVMFDAISRTDSRIRIEPGAFCSDSDGTANLGVIALLADIALASVVRANLTPSQRLGTVSLHLQLSGAPCSGSLVAEGAFAGFLDGAAGHQGLSRVRLTAGGQQALVGHGAFMVLHPPPGVTMHPVTSADHSCAAPLAESALETHERAVLAHADAALAAVTPDTRFIQHFWGQAPYRSATGAKCATANGPQIGNRVGHVQGGLQVALAALTAAAALPPDWMLSGISAWFIRAAQGRTLHVTSRIVHHGRNTAVVRSVIAGRGRQRMLEVVTTHVPRAQE